MHTFEHSVHQNYDPFPLPYCHTHQMKIPGGEKKIRNSGAHISLISHHSVQQLTHITGGHVTATLFLSLLHLAVKIVISIFTTKVAPLVSALTGTLTSTTRLTREPEHNKHTCNNQWQDILHRNLPAYSYKLYNTKFLFFFSSMFFFCKRGEWGTLKIKQLLLFMVTHSFCEM